MHVWGKVLVLVTSIRWAGSIAASELGIVLVLAMMCLDCILALMCWDCVLAMICWDCVLATLCIQTRSVHGRVRLLVVPPLGRDCRLLTLCQQTCNTEPIPGHVIPRHACLILVTPA